MRRGHPGIGSWRGDNSRHFRPRGGGPPHFRPSMLFGLGDTPRFPPPVQRYRGPRPFKSHPIHSDDSGPSEPERMYRGPGHPSNQLRQERGHHDNRERQILPQLMQLRSQESNCGGSYNKSQSFFDGNQFNTNNMGDVDHRPQDLDLRQLNFGPRQNSPWANPPFERRPYNDIKTPKTPKHHSMGDALLPLPDYTGHRPPSSDHYSDTSGPNNNNNPYSRSVDDTVDIVRKRLMNRDSQEHSDQSIDQREMETDLGKNLDEDYREIPQEQPVKKRVQRQINSNCDKMKNKIVHQLFKMDKGKIHKLMDNPNSSSKFEYAINSLITESQNSLNRHMRSVAEKSLTTTSTSSDFIHDDNNTIYEDTFMRQMQGILDPQDTVLLEDIKPLVLAELSKVLCLGDFDRCEEFEDHGRYPRDNHAYYNEPDSQNLHNDFHEYDPEPKHDTEDITGDLYEDKKYDFAPLEESEVLYVRRPAKQLEFHDDTSHLRSTESFQPRKSVENNPILNKSNEDNSKDKDDEEPRPLFDRNCDQFSEDDDPFAELDNQYHVAVDHTFIEQEYEELVPEQVDHLARKSPSTNDTKDIKVSLPLPSVPSTESNDVLKEIDTQLQSIAKSPLKLSSTLANDIEKPKSKSSKIKQNIEKNVSAFKDTLLPISEQEIAKVKQEPTPAKESDGEPVTHANGSRQHNSRKRSVDTKPCHRKEKRKKSSHSECHEAAASIYNMFYDIKPSGKDNKTVDSADKEYSDKYVKRKDPPKKSKEKVENVQKKLNSNNTSHSITSPKDNSSSSMGDQTPSRLDKVKLTAVDIFSGAINQTKPKKGSAHQSHRNTSTSTPLAVANSPDENKIKPVIPTMTSFARKLSRRHIGTQVIRKLRHKECQTLVHKKSNTGTQTDPVKFEKNQRISAEPLERMKEIDMEIQMLLQEKFKLYSSMETNNKNTMSSGSTMGTLGMAVLNVPIENEENYKEDNDDSLADSIADDFTSLPVEELEQIAMETLEGRKSSSPFVDKRSRRQKVAEISRKNSESPTMRNKKAKIKTPNISLLEQIITDDRPIEEIISLDDLETTPVRSKKKSSSRSSKKKLSRKHNSKPFVLDLNSYDLKECYVVLERLDLPGYLKARADNLKIKINLKSLQNDLDKTEIEASIKYENVTRAQSPISETILSDHPERSSPEPIVEPVNDIQIDMMEVCEDIVIGDEVKMITDANERLPISEEIILDNSQSSAEYSAPEIKEGECKMYDYSTDDTLKRDAVTVTGNADAVLALECLDNSFIAACVDGNVYHFSTDGQLINTLRGSNLPVTCLTIVKEKYGTTVYTGSLDSRIRYYDLDTGLEKGPECNVLSPIQTMDRAWDTVFVGTRTGFVLQFECKNNMLIPVSTVKFSEQSILALRALREGPRKVLLVAARSDNVTIKDAQTGLLLRTLDGPKMTVYSLLFEDGKVYCGTSSHQIHVFDYTSGGHVHAHEGGKGAVCLRATGGLVFAGCYDGCVYVYREGETRPLAQLRGPALMLLSLAIQGTKIIAGYKDRSLYIWKIPLAVLQEMIL